MRSELCIGVLFLLTISGVAYGIDCYDCSSTGSDNCLDVPNGPALIVSGHVASGCPSCVKEFKALGTVFYTITRRCGDSSETTDECRDVLGYGTCVCTTSFCNTGVTMATSKHTIIVCYMIIVAFFLFRN